MWSAKNITVNQNSYFVEFVPTDIADGYAAAGFFFVFLALFFYILSASVIWCFCKTRLIMSATHPERSKLVEPAFVGPSFKKPTIYLNF